MAYALKPAALAAAYPPAILTTPAAAILKCEPLQQGEGSSLVGRATSEAAPIPHCCDRDHSGIEQAMNQIQKATYDIGPNMPVKQAQEKFDVFTEHEKNLLKQKDYQENPVILVLLAVCSIFKEKIQLPYPRLKQEDGLTDPLTLLEKAWEIVTRNTKAEELYPIVLEKSDAAYRAINISPDNITRVLEGRRKCEEAGNWVRIRLVKQFIDVKQFDIAEPLLINLIEDYISRMIPSQKVAIIYLLHCMSIQTGKEKLDSFTKALAPLALASVQSMPHARNPQERAELEEIGKGLRKLDSYIDLEQRVLLDALSRKCLEKAAEPGPSKSKPSRITFLALGILAILAFALYQNRGRVFKAFF